MTNSDNKHKENNIKMTNVCEDSEKQSQIAKTIQNTVEVMVSLLVNVKKPTFQFFAVKSSKFNMLQTYNSSLLVMRLPFSVSSPVDLIKFRAKLRI